MGPFWGRSVLGIGFGLRAFGSLVLGGGWRVGGGGVGFLASVL